MIRFWSLVLVATATVALSQAKCHRQETLCGDICVEEGRVRNDNDLYCCNNEMVKMTVPCNGDCYRRRSLCGNTCVEEGRVWKDNDLYCCNNEIVNMTVPCNGNCYTDKNKRRSLCGNSSDATCIYSAMEFSYRGKVFCCRGQVVGRKEKCEGCDFDSLPCNSSSPTDPQCLHIWKWCDGTRDCRVSFIIAQNN